MVGGRGAVVKADLRLLPSTLPLTGSTGGCQAVVQCNWIVQPDLVHTTGVLTLTVPNSPQLVGRSIYDQQYVVSQTMRCFGFNMPDGILQAKQITLL